MFRFTLNNDFNQSENRKIAVEFAKQVQHILIWASLPCTGGTPWNFINNKIPSARKKVANHRKLFNLLWKSFEAFLDEMGHLSPSIAIEWPKGCTYWKLPKVKSILDKHGLDKSDFDGCAVGIVNADGIPLKSLGLLLLMSKCWGKRCLSSNAGVLLHMRRVEANH